MLRKKDTKGAVKWRKKRKVSSARCKACEKLYIEETKFNLDIILKQHMKDLQLSRTNNAVGKHMVETKHKIG